MERPPLPPIARLPSDPTALADRDRAKSALFKNIYLIIIIVLMLITCAILFFSIKAIRPPDESIASWIERFGALIGIMALLIEYRLKRMNDVLMNSSMQLPRELFLSLKGEYRRIPFFEKLALTSATFGAIIWAYGSVIIYWLSVAVAYVRSAICG